MLKNYQRDKNIKQWLMIIMNYQCRSPHHQKLNNHQEAERERCNSTERVKQRADQFFFFVGAETNSLNLLLFDSSACTQ